VDSLVKQRLVGALILVALAVVFWPIIFMPAPEQRGELRVPVPAAPPVDLTSLPEPDNAGLRQGEQAQARTEVVQDLPFPGDGNEPLTPATLPDRADTVTEPELATARETLEAPEMDADGLPIAYSLQVATMTDKTRADALRDELVAAGYKGYTKRVRRNDRVLYRVLVGPKFSRDDLQPVKTAVDETWRVESMIIRYLP
jgi:DedD protein